MPSTDLFVLVSVQATLVVLSIYAFIQDIRIQRKEKRGGIESETLRGARSMASLYAVYAAALGTLLLLIDRADDAKGQQLLLMLASFLCVTYLFFFSTWFRNAVFFPLANRIRKD